MYKIFHRTWWRHNPDWPDGREPGVGRPITIKYVNTEEEARLACFSWNKAHDPGFLSDKAEYEFIDWPLTPLLPMSLQSYRIGKNQYVTTDFYKSPGLRNSFARFIARLFKI